MENEDSVDDAPLLRPVPRPIVDPRTPAPGPLYAWAVEAPPPVYLVELAKAGLQLRNIKNIVHEIERTVNLADDAALIDDLRAWNARLVARDPSALQRLASRSAHRGSGANVGAVPSAADLALGAMLLSLRLAQRAPPPPAQAAELDHTSDYATLAGDFDHIVSASSDAPPFVVLASNTPHAPGVVLHKLGYMDSASSLKEDNRLANAFLFGFYVTNRLRTIIPTFQYILGAVNGGALIRARRIRMAGERDAPPVAAFDPDRPNRLYVLAERIDGERLGDFFYNRRASPARFRPVAYSLILQVLLALQVLAEHDAHAAHHALYGREVIVQDLGEERVVTFPVGGGAVHFRTRFLARIDNFTRASARVPPTDVWLGEADASLGLFPGAPNRMYDAAYFLGDLAGIPFRPDPEDADEIVRDEITHALGIEWLAQIAAPPGWLERGGPPEGLFAPALDPLHDVAPDATRRFDVWGERRFRVAAPVGVDLLDLALRGLLDGVPAARALGVPGAAEPPVLIDRVRFAGRPLSLRTPAWAPAAPVFATWPGGPRSPPLAASPIATNEKFVFIPRDVYVEL